MYPMRPIAVSYTYLTLNIRFMTFIISILIVISITMQYRNLLVCYLHAAFMQKLSISQSLSSRCRGGAATSRRHNRCWCCCCKLSFHSEHFRPLIKPTASIIMYWHFSIGGWTDCIGHRGATNVDIGQAFAMIDIILWTYNSVFT